MICKQCGANVPEGVHYCVICGYPIEQASSREEAGEATGGPEEAKTANESARKATGKSAAPKVIALIAVIIVAVGIGAGAMWLFLGQQSDPAPAQSSASAQQNGIDSYVGIWKGDMVEPTHYAFVGCCYGAEEHPLVLNIKKVSDTGRITADASVLFHEHEDLHGDDAATTDGDTYLELHDLVATLSADGAFSFHDELTDRGEYEEVTITVKTVDAPDGTPTLEATVDSQVLGGYATDSYVLEMQ